MSTLQVNTISESTSANGVTIDGVLIKDGLVDGKDVSAIASGITEYDSWYLSASVTSDADITANLVRASGTLVQKIGTGMSQSSGIFTFPSTGLWRVSAKIFSINVAGDTVLCYIVSSDDNFSSEARVGLAKFGSGASGSATGGTGYGEVLLDIEDVSTGKVKFEAVSINSGSYLTGGTFPDATAFTFERLGDT